MIMGTKSEPAIPPLVLSQGVYMECNENGSNFLTKTYDDQTLETKELVRQVDLNSVCDGVDNNSSDDDEEPLFMSRIRERIIHSSDEDDNTLLNLNKLPASPAKSVGSELGIGRRIIDDDSDSDEPPLPSHEVIQDCRPEAKIHYSRAIFDTETTDEEDNQNDDSLPELDSSDDGSSSNAISAKGNTKKSGKSRNQERKEIRSVSQRMIRESQLTLPYHRPKQRTLLDFLQRKKSVSCIEKRKSLKMSMKDLDYLREIEKRKEEVDIFFKSDSEDESSEKMTKDNSDTLLIVGDEAHKEPFKDIRVQSSLDHVSQTPTKNMNNEIPPQIDDETRDEWSQETNEIFINDETSQQTTGKNSTNEMPSQIEDKESEAIAKKPLPIEGEINEKSTNENITEISIFETCEKSPEEKVNQAASQIEDDSAKKCILTTCEMPSESEVQSEVSEVQTSNTMIVDTCQLPDLEQFVHMGEVASVANGLIMSNVKPDCTATILHNISELERCQQSSEECLLNSHNSNKKIEMFDDDDDDDFKLHLDTEDIEETVNTMKIVNEESGFPLASDVSSKEVESNHRSSSVKGSHKLNRLVTKFPHLNINKLTDVKPKLSVSDGDFVDLDEERYNTPLHENGVSDLLHRFVRHSNTKTKLTTPQQVMLGIVSKEISTEGEEQLVHSNICVSVDAKKDLEPNNESPGARLARLKTTLRSQLLKQRELERQRKVNEKQFLESENIIQDYPDDGLPQDEPVLTDESDTETEESEPEEEDDVILEDQHHKRNQFVDDEAEEDDDDDDYNLDGDDDYTGGQSVAPDHLCEDGENHIDAGESSEDEDSHSSVPLTLKRKPVNRISDDDEEDSNMERMEDSWTIRYSDDVKSPTRKDVPKPCLEDADTQDVMVERPSSSHTFSRMNTNEDMFVSQSERSIADTGLKVPREASLEWQDSSYLPGYQPARSEESKQHLSDVGEASLDASMNSSGLTLFSKLEYGQRGSVMDDKVDNGQIRSALNLLLTPLKESQISSGNTQSIKRSLLLDAPAGTALKESSTTDDLLSLCSGKFTTDNSQNFYSLGLNAEPGTQNLEEMVGLCSGRFDTQNIIGDRSQHHSRLDGKALETDDTAQQSTMSGEGNRSVSCDTVKDSGIEDKQTLVVYSSDEEGILLRQRQTEKRGKRKRIVTLCDDEDSENDSLDSLSNVEEESEVEYDENEEPIIKEKCTGFKNSRGGIRADFLENEAELSGSDEGSDDEEEPDEDHDFMELEEGDAEKFDEEELRDQVGRAHMKSMIDTDKRELRLLQELYLEDGDLHGEGRRKQFRWKNIDKSGVDDDQRADEVEEEENTASEELDWRRQRLEREKFLQEQEQQQKEEVSSKIENSFSDLDSSLKLVQSVKKNLMPLKLLNSTPRDSPLFLNTRTKRGSFLSRDESTLKRLADLANENAGVGTARQGGNFVFQTLTEEEAEARVSKRRTSHNAGNQPEKKSRMERSFFSMEESSRSKSIFKYL